MTTKAARVLLGAILFSASLGFAQEPEAAPPSVVPLDGIVTRDHAPAPGIEVEVLDLVTLKQVAVLQSDAQGKFATTIPEPELGPVYRTDKPEGGIVIIAQAPGQIGILKERWSPNFPKFKSRRVELRESREITITVLDPEGNPCPDASVEALAEGVPYVTAVTDAAGKVVLTCPAGSGFLAVKPGIGAGAATFNVPLPAETVIRMQKPKPMAVRLQDAMGNGVAGVDVTPEHMPNTLLGTLNSRIARVKTGENGIARFDWFPDVPRRRMNFAVCSPDWAATETFQQKPTADWELSCTVSRRTLLKGQVLLPDGKPAQKVLVYAARKPAFPPGTIPRTMTGADGRFAMRLIAGTYTVYPQSDEWSAAPLRVTLDEGAAVEDIAIHLVTPAILRVRGIEGGNSVSLYRRTGKERPNREFNGEVEGARIHPMKAVEGNADIVFPVTHGKYTLLAAGYQSEIEVTDQPEIIVSIEMGVNVFAGKFSGRATYHGEPLPGAIVRVINAEGDTELPAMVAAEDGTFSGEAPQGRWVAYATDAHQTMAATAPLRSDRPAEIALDRASTARFRLVDEAGKPLANAAYSYTLMLFQASPGARDAEGIPLECRGKTSDTGEVAINCIPIRTAVTFNGLAEGGPWKRHSIRLNFGAEIRDDTSRDQVSVMRAD